MKIVRLPIAALQRTACDRRELQLGRGVPVNACLTKRSNSVGHCVLKTQQVGQFEVTLMLLGRRACRQA